MCSVQEEAIPQQLNQLTGELQCVKCRRDVPVVVTRVNDAFCQDCFLVYAVHKFRSTIGKTKVIVPKDHVLVAYSGGPASTALLHFLQEGKKEGKLRFTVTVVHIDELGLVSISASERHEVVGKVVKNVQHQGFPLLLTSLEQAIDNRAEAKTTISATKLCQKVTAPENIAAPVDSDKADKLKQLLDSLPSISAREEFLRVLRNQLLVEVARQEGFSKVVVGDTATTLSVRIMTDMAKGKGGQVSFDTSIGDKRYGDIMTVRPLRELNLKEIITYNNLQQMVPVSIPSTKDQWHRGNSIEQLTASFVLGLQESFPSTVPNIVRTSDKLGQQDSHAEQQHCTMCQTGSSPYHVPHLIPLWNDKEGGLQLLAGSLMSPLDTDVGEASALRAVEISEQLLQGGGPSSVQSQTMPLQSSAKPNRSASEDLKKSLCYGCRLIMKGLKDVSLLPAFIFPQSRGNCLSRDEMHAQIADCLLEEDGEGI